MCISFHDLISRKNILLCFEDWFFSLFLSTNVSLYIQKTDYTFLVSSKRKIILIVRKIYPPTLQITWFSLSHLGVFSFTFKYFISIFQLSNDFWVIFSINQIITLLAIDRYLIAMMTIELLINDCIIIVICAYSFISRRSDLAWN